MMVQANIKGAVLETVNMWSYINTPYAEAQPEGRPFCPCTTLAYARENEFDLTFFCNHNSPNDQKRVFSIQMAARRFQTRIMYHCGSTLLYG